MKRAAPARRHESCIYEGAVDHCRFSPKRHAFHFPLFMMYLDLDELPALFEKRWLWSSTRAAPARFRRSDYPGDPSQPLDVTIRAMVERECGVRPKGPVRLLTHLRYFGYGFNPASFFYCFDEAATRVEAVVVYVTNTPWGETHAYVVTPRPGSSGGGIEATRAKQFHVSPFLPMDLDHEFVFSFPGDSLAVRMLDRRGGVRIFTADLRLQRREIGAWSLARVLCRYPFMTARVIAGIYAQALRLYRKNVPYHPHPESV